MSALTFNRRQLLATSAALGSTALMPRIGVAADTVVATTYPGSFEEAYRAVLLPGFSEKTGAEVTLTPLLAVDQVAKITAARQNPPYDVVIFDEGPLLASLQHDILQKFPEDKSENISSLPEAFQGGHAGGYGPTVTLQIIGIAYNPSKIETPPTSWNDLWKPEFEGRVGLTGMQSSLGTSYMCEIAKLHGGSESDFEPAFVRIQDLLPSVTAIAPSPGALAALFQTGEIDIAPNYFNSVMLLREKDVDIAFAVPESGPVLIRTTLHVVKNTKVPDLAVQYIDTAISAEIQQQLLDPPYYFTPTNSQVEITGAIAKIAPTVEQLIQRSTLLDWPEINKHRPALIERFNKEVRV